MPPRTKLIVNGSRIRPGIAKTTSQTSGASVVLAGLERILELTECSLAATARTWGGSPPGVL